jgi:hypothetical protein
MPKLVGLLIVSAQEIAMRSFMTTLLEIAMFLGLVLGYVEFFCVVLAGAAFISAATFLVVFSL